MLKAIGHLRNKKSKTKTYKDANYFNIYLRYTDLCVLDVDEMKFDYNKLPKEIQKLSVC